MCHPVPRVFWRNFKKFSDPETFVCLPVLILENLNKNYITESGQHQLIYFLASCFYPELFAQKTNFSFCNNRDKCCKLRGKGWFSLHFLADQLPACRRLWQPALNWKRVNVRYNLLYISVVVLLFGAVGNNGPPSQPARLLTKHHCYSIVGNNVNHQHPRNSRASQKFWKTGNF